MTSIAQTHFNHVGKANPITNFSTMFAAYPISTLPLLIVFVYATRPFIQGVAHGALKA